MKILAILIVCLTIFGMSCRVKCETDPPIWAQLSGYDSTTSRYILVAYQNNSKFDHVENVKVYDLGVDSSYAYSDTNYYPLSIHSIYQPPSIQFTTAYDYIVFVPSINKIYKISNISYEHLSTPGSFCCWECNNGIYYTLDGTENHIAGNAPAYEGNFVDDLFIVLTK